MVSHLRSRDRWQSWTGVWTSWDEMQNVLDDGFVCNFLSAIIHGVISVRPEGVARRPNGYHSVCKLVWAWPDYSCYANRPEENMLSIILE